MFRRTLALKLVEMGHEAGSEQDNLAASKLLDRGFHLRPEDELLVESILNRDLENEDLNPFDLYLDTAALSPRGSMAGGTTPSTLEELDTELMDLALDHDWNDCNSMMDSSTLGSLTIRKCVPEVAQTVKRLSTVYRAADDARSVSSHRRGGGTTLSVISEDGEYQTTDCAAASSRGHCPTAPSSCGPLRQFHRRQPGRDYLKEMREERALGQLYDFFFWPHDCNV